MNEFIKDLLRKNFTAKTIISRCKKQGWDVKTEQIEILRSEVELELTAERKSKNNMDSKNTKIIQLFNEQESYFDFAKRVGVNVDYKSTSELVTTIQKITADIFIKQSVIIMRVQELQSQGIPIDGYMFFKNYEIAYKGFYTSWKNIIDVNAAFHCLISKGYINENHALSQIPEIHPN